ncbi:hypothetical protein NHF50_13095 [Flavobacterium sp. NRK F10]|uniref:M56 family metallopeptidase n=1 Tax=Flavobacterium sp. NRK F10 TaxID=2954931 RepID=UPI00209199DB|nr:M56 family metallopeptidase [Flavobacterium sp. NRK F10]MCO6175981.1 hypothetical protein [Flavobacterium sp. NRK F10]
MDVLWLYFLKVNGLLLLHYGVYQFFLKKETFFQTNRWFLIAGVFISFLLPLFSYTKIIWVDPEPQVQNYFPFVSANSTASIPSVDVTEIPIDWNFIATSVYSIIALLLATTLLLEIFSLIRIFRQGNRRKENNIWVVETSQGQNPFSFFNILVYNKEKFTTEELNLIFLHERVHIEQRHSFDVLLGKILCFILWINPVSWLYRKAILQNLEYIADSETARLSNNSYQYQKTLVKTIINHNQLSITNQFYQSLIKKRIVMLNTNPSSKKKMWKYTVVLPLLTLFFLAFQIKTLAQVKERVFITPNDETTEFIITKNTTDEEIKKETAILKKEHDVTFKVSKLKRNTDNEIIALDIKFKDKDGSTGRMSANGDQPIQPIRFFKEVDMSGKTNMGFGGKQLRTVFKKIETMGPKSVKIGDSLINIKTVEIRKSSNSDQSELYIINGKEYTKDELKNQKIELEEGSVLQLSEEDAIEKFGKKGKNGVIIMNGNATFKYDDDSDEEAIYIVNGKQISPNEFKTLKTKQAKTVHVYTNTNDEEETEFIIMNDMMADLPEPPAPPTFNFDNLPPAPKAPSFPNPPALPSDLSDEKAMKDYEKQIKAFEKKMENMEPQIKEFEKKMEKFEKEMLKREPAMKKYEEAMKVYEEKMKAYEEKIGAYQKKLEKMY